MSNETTNIAAIPKIYKAICNIIGDIGAVGKDKKNEQQNYRYCGLPRVQVVRNRRGKERGELKLLHEVVTGLDKNRNRRKMRPYGQRVFGV